MLPTPSLMVSRRCRDDARAHFVHACWLATAPHAGPPKPRLTRWSATSLADTAVAPPV